MSSFFFLQADKNFRNQSFIESLEHYANNEKEQIYVISRPLSDTKYQYEHKDALIVLTPKRKIAFVDFSDSPVAFSEFADDFIEDLAYLSDKYRYKEVIGRPRSWSNELTFRAQDGGQLSIDDWCTLSKVDDPAKQRTTELLVSLLTGSINDIDRVRADVPDGILEKVKRKILLLDADQTRFVYDQPEKNIVRIQGLSGTGKTELLMHKLKDLYVNNADSKILFTCHNKILSDSLSKRIPDFFNFMKVEEQIAWDERLWCVHAWGSQRDPNSGAYRLICEKYDIPFQRFSKLMSFDDACKMALNTINARGAIEPAFDYMLIDESQDFADSFISLCEKVTKHTIYVAGDIFQGIFDERITPEIQPDLLLSKCYRTDPRTLMISHAIGMGLLEPEKLRWLDDPEWEACGYIVEKGAGGSPYRLKREPLRRFEDIDNTIPSVVIEELTAGFWTGVAPAIIDAIKNLQNENPSLTPDDVGIILLDAQTASYRAADQLQLLAPRELGWEVNKAYESKRRERGQLFISNRNNVKGLEFPFVICVAEQVSKSPIYRNALYMTMTRSFIQTRVIISAEQNAQLLGFIRGGLDQINKFGVLEVAPPTAAEQEKIRTRFKAGANAISYFDQVEMLCDELQVEPSYRQKIKNALDAMSDSGQEQLDFESMRQTIETIHATLRKTRR